MSDENGNTSSIDDLLVSSSAVSKPYVPQDTAQSQAAEMPEVDEVEPVQADAQDYESDTDDSGESAELESADTEVDDYGNVRAHKVYTEDEVNERINRAVRERLDRIERNQSNINPNSAQNVQNQASNSSGTQNGENEWQQQLETFVEQTVLNMSQKKAQEAQMRVEQNAQAEFEGKFRSGMARFDDFQTVVGSQPITDAMTVASRAMADPAAFFYAASKRAPQELQRIAQIPDQYAQMVEIGKLDERMKKQKASTQAPKPLGRMQEDGLLPHKKAPKEPSIEELIARDAAKRKLIQDSRRRR